VSAARCAAYLFGCAICCLANAEEGSTSAATAPRGVNSNLVYSGSIIADVGGGLRRGATYGGILDLQLDFDAAALLGWPDAIAHVDALWLQGGLPGALVGDTQGVSNISASNSVKIYEAWIQKNFRANQVSMLAGLYDLNSEFYRLQSAGLFLNSSFGIGPEFSQSGVGGPSIFPDTSLGLRLALKPVEGIVLRTAVLDGVPVARPDGSRAAFERGDGALVVAEAAFLDRPAPDGTPSNHRFRLGRQAMLGEYQAKLAVGGWYYTAAYDDLADTQADGLPVRHRGSGGLYVLADRVLLQAPDRPKLSAFVQAGLGDGRVNRFGSYLGAGLSMTGPFAGRRADELGLGLAYARNGSHYLGAQQSQCLPVTSAEQTIELTYLARLDYRLALQPDLQHVRSPGTTPSIPDAWVFQLRFEIAL
jgi:porin